MQMLKLTDGNRSYMIKNWKMGEKKIKSKTMINSSLFSEESILFNFFSTEGET